jgi:hypothetical protein
LHASGRGRKDLLRPYPGPTPIGGGAMFTIWLKSLR